VEFVTTGRLVDDGVAPAKGKTTEGREMMKRNKKKGNNEKK
jgi:hypothetical protein